jgi:RNA polymerase sigma factor (sigma-70 family)
MCTRQDVFNHFNHNQGQLFRQALRQTWNDELAIEIVSEAKVRVLKHVDEDRPIRENLEKFVGGVIRNICVEYSKRLHREQVRTRALTLVLKDQSSQRGRRSGDDPGLSPSERALLHSPFLSGPANVHRSRLARLGDQGGGDPSVGIDIRTAMQRLPAKLVHVLNLRYWKGLSLERIASSLQYSTAQVGKDLNEAHEKLRKILVSYMSLILAMALSTLSVLRAALRKGVGKIACKRATVAIAGLSLLAIGAVTALLVGTGHTGGCRESIRQWEPTIHVPEGSHTVLYIGKRLFIGNDDGSFKVCNGDSLRPPANYYPHRAVVTGMAWSARANRGFSVSEDGKVVAFTLTPNYQEVGVYEEGERVCCLATSPSGRFIAVLRRNQNVTVRIAETGRLVDRFRASGRAVGFASEDTVVYAALKRTPTLQMRRVETPHATRELGRCGELTSVAVAPGKTFVVTASEEEAERNVLTCWPLTEGKATVLGEYRSTIRQLVFSPGGQCIALGLGNNGFPAAIELWDTSSWKHRTTSFPTKVTGVAFHSDGDRLAVASGEQVYVFQTTRLKPDP